MLNFPNIERINFKWSARLIIKFEDLKLNTQKTLLEICKNWGITWSDTFMETTINGKKLVYGEEGCEVSDFDLRPVYNLNEKYFSEFDRLRIMLINAPYQKKYGYPYVRISQFTRRELQEMFLKKFKFEEFFTPLGERLETEFKCRICAMIRSNLQQVKMMEIIEE